jgi:hypothetical protein
MGKASQSKKVARAARAAAPIKPSRRRWLWPATIVAILVVGGLVIVASRQQSHPAPVQQITNEATSTTAAPTATTAATGAATTLNPATATTAATGSTAATATTASPSTTVATSTSKP